MEYIPVYLRTVLSVPVVASDGCKLQLVAVHFGVGSLRDPLVPDVELWRRLHRYFKGKLIKLQLLPR